MRIHLANHLLSLAILLFFVLCSACRSVDKKDMIAFDTQGKVKGNISISGAFALYPITVRWAEEYKKLHPGINIDISAGGAGKGMADVLSGMVDLAMFSREVSREEIEKGAWKIAVAKDAVFATVNAKNPAIDEILRAGLTRDQFQWLFSSETQKNWSSFSGIESEIKINIYTRSDACGAAAMWARFFGMNQEDLHGVGVFGDPGIADAVKKDRFGVGYNNLVYVYDAKTKHIVDGLAIIPIDLNRNRIIDPEENFYTTMDSAMIAIREGRYPSPPARDLYLISKGKPAGELILGFLEYILTDGQLIIPQAGYVQLDDLIVREARNRLELSHSESK